MTSAAANSRNSCCSRTARLARIVEFAWQRPSDRAVRRVPPSVVGFRRAAFSPAMPPAREPQILPRLPLPEALLKLNVPFVFPFPLPMLLTYSDSFKSLSNSRAIYGHRRHGVLIIQPRRPNHGSDPHHFAADARRSANQDEICISNGIASSSPNHYRTALLPRIKIGPSNFTTFLFPQASVAFPVGADDLLSRRLIRPRFVTSSPRLRRIPPGCRPSPPALPVVELIEGISSAGRTRLRSCSRAEPVRRACRSSSSRENFVM